MRTRIYAAVAAAMLCFGAASASAAPIVYNFTGTVSLVNGLAVDNGYALGQSVTGTLTYDSSATLNPALQIDRQGLIDAGFQPLPAGTPTPDDQSYFHDGMDPGVSQTAIAFGDFGLFSLSMTIGGTSFTPGTGGTSQESFIRHRTNEWVNTPDRPAFAYDSLLAIQQDLVDIFDTGGNFVGREVRMDAGIRLMDDAVFSGMFPLDQLLTELPGIDEMFKARAFTTVDFDNDGIAESQIWAVLDSLTAVPGPAPFGILVIGLLGLVARRR
jgi:hypothetical protein